MLESFEELFDYEAKTITKLSKLTSSSVSPSNLERQKVALALNVFSDQTASALQNSEAKKDAWEMTAMFILKVVKLWKVLNCKSMNERARLKDEYRVAIDSNEENKGVGVLKEWADYAKSMTSTKGHGRKHCLTTDTRSALHHTCCTLLNASKFLLSTNTSVRHDFVPLGFFQQDDLEAHFSHFRMAAGCNFYITVQPIRSTKQKSC
ncbi:developmentally-regulated GTP-binding protein 2 [Plakobranchus ocellatus]|uniref:Developmentally-regulated GTP-binding protein 2 n=1 Tax=Plakobranchus ocellatus TaxID=259542 RepID=A0AAV4C2H3_9GAST|nr:developmentally-regulated GTP-binding protein 2 [Plakobranchus ocellatus]